LRLNLLGNRGLKTFQTVSMSGQELPASRIQLIRNLAWKLEPLKRAARLQPWGNLAPLKERGLPLTEEIV
jgi:hypothetical protein